MITLLVSLDENNPTYWYYYCTEATSEIDLKDFRKMNTLNSGNELQSSETVYDTISSTGSSRVTENMIFVFDFSEVAEDEWASAADMEGQVMLRHTYKGNTYSADIMDYASSVSKDNGDSTVYTYSREVPKQTETFKISKDSDGITQFELTNGDEDTVYGQRDVMKFRMNIAPDTDVTNTQYEEREYAVVLTLHRKNETSEIAFPEGTIFTYNGEQLTVGKDNRYVIVPVKTVGSHEVEIESKMYGFEEGEYVLAAKLYSTSEDGYFNSIPVRANDDTSSTAGFTIQKNPVYALKVEEKSAALAKEDERREKNHLIHAGESFSFEVASQGGEPEDVVEAVLYQYAGKVYQPIALSDVFEQAPELNTGNARSWNPVVTEDAETGTYRLAFTYHDKVEYWDFIITR